VYLDKGLGAAILRADVRLWDRTSVSPVAAIKLTRHNLWCPTALLHETGHQFAHLTGWTGELADCLAQSLAPRSAELASAWRGWASEVAADVHAFVQAGWAPLGSGEDETHPKLIALVGFAMLFVVPLVWGLLRRGVGLPMFGKPTIEQIEEPESSEPRPSEKQPR